jgi:integrase
MAKLVKRLSDRFVKSARPGFYHDGDGLYLQVTSATARSWIYRYKLDGKTKDVGLGSLKKVGLAKARQNAEEQRQLRGEGKDPIKQRRVLEAAQRLATAGATTFRGAAEELIASHEAGWRNPKHRQQWRNTLSTYVYPAIGNKSVAEIDTEDVLGVLKLIWQTKTETASRVRGRIEAVLSWASAKGLRNGTNPAQWRGHLDKLLPKRSKVAPVEHHAAMPYKDVPVFIARLRANDSITARCLEFTILTAVRTSEATNARFTEFDLAVRVWRIPGERMKANQEHRVPLCDRAVVIVKDMVATRLGPYVFPGLMPDAPLSNMAMLMMLRDLQPGVTTHGFRSSFRDWAGEETAHPHDICEAALAHTRKDKSHAAYQRGDLLAKRRRLMTEWADYCTHKARHTHKRARSG